MKTIKPFKMKKNLLACLFMCGSLLSAQAQTVFETVEQSPDHTILETALIATGLDAALSDPFGQFTLFAPNDAAFNALPPGVLADLLADPGGELTTILSYHVLGIAVYSFSLTDGATFTSLTGQDLEFSVVGPDIFVNDAMIIDNDLDGENGVVHSIDAVLIPENLETIWSIIMMSEVHQTLEAALAAAGLDDVLADEEESFTVFAPTDAAFDALEASSPGIIAELLANPDGELANVLLYHVVNGVAFSSSLSNGQMIQTAQGEMITVTITGGNVFINNAQVTTADIPASNGVVHIIDAVLLPQSCVIFNAGPYVDFNIEFGGAPVSVGGFCPVNTITGFQAWASEAYSVDNFVAGTEYTFSICDGPDAGSWDAELSIQNSVTGAVVASATGCEITWTSPGNGTFLIIIQEADFCGDASPNQSTNNGFPSLTCSTTATVVDVIVNSAVHNTLETALIAAGLVGTLSGEGPFTVFAPTDAAFEALETGVLDGLLADPTGALTQVLTHHVALGLVLSTDLTDGMSITSLQGENLLVGIDGTTVTITSGSSNVATVTTANIVVSNGVVHVIDVVLIPSIVNVDNIASIASLGVYPNPTNNQFTIDLDLTTSNRVSVDLISLTGQLVKGLDLGNRSVGLNREYFNITDVAAGFYLMTITVGDSQVTTKVQIAR